MTTKEKIQKSGGLKNDEKEGNQTKNADCADMSLQSNF